MKGPPLRLRILIIIALMGVINFYSAARIINRWEWAQHHITSAWLTALAFFLLQLAGPFGDHHWLPRLKRNLKTRRLAYAIDWLSYFAIGVLSLLVIYGFIIDLFTIGLALFSINPSDYDNVFLLALGV